MRFDFPAAERDGDGFSFSGHGGESSESERRKGSCALDGESFVAKAFAHAYWQLAPTHQSLERAGLVVVNACESVRRSVSVARCSQVNRYTVNVRPDVGSALGDAASEREDVVSVRDNVVYEGHGGRVAAFALEDVRRRRGPIRRSPRVRRRLRSHEVHDDRVHRKQGRDVPRERDSKK